jgi:hypothetical protein
MMPHLKTTILAFVFICAFITPANAQKFEIHPYAGGFFSGKVAGLLDVKNQPLYGIKGGIFANKNFEIEGNIGYINNLSFVGTLTRKHGYIGEGLATYNLSKFYGSYGLGAVITSVSTDSTDFFGNAIPTRDTFLSMSYGGGFKVLRKWGPLGYRLDARGRTLPNYNGFTYSWFEATAGLTIAWGDR